VDCVAIDKYSGTEPPQCVELAPMRCCATPIKRAGGSEVLDQAQRAEEWLSLRMRLLEPIDLLDASERVGRDLAPAVDGCEALGLLDRDGRTFSLTRKGMLLENEVTLRLLGA